jgi:hypothetical protein
MRWLVVIAASGRDDDLVALAEASVRREVPDADVLILRGATSHGAKLDRGRSYCVQYDVAVTLDSDVVVWSGWRSWIEQTLKEPDVVACGAPRVDDSWGLHPSMLALKGDLYAKSPSWQPSAIGDTGVAVCHWLEGQGKLLAADSQLAYEGWWRFVTPGDEPGSVVGWQEGVGQVRPRWWHLGSGSSSRWTWRCLVDREAWGRWRRRKAFVRAARERLAQ